MTRSPRPTKDQGAGVPASPSGSRPTDGAASVSTADAASIPNAAALATELTDLIDRATDEDLDDRGRYFSDSFGDLTQCSHGDTGEYGNPRDGRLIEFLWNNRRTFVAALKASGTEARSGETEGLDPKGDGPTLEEGDAQ